MATTPGKLGNKALTGELRKLASGLHTTDDQGNEITREQALADLIWKQALGWEEVRRNPQTGSLEKIWHPPVAWAQQYLYERIDGKAPQSVPDNETGIRAADKVRELVKDRLNARAAAIAGPPKFTPK